MYRYENSQPELTDFYVIHITAEAGDPFVAVKPELIGNLGLGQIRSLSTWAGSWLKKKFGKQPEVLSTLSDDDAAVFSTIFIIFSLSNGHVRDRIGQIVATGQLGYVFPMLIGTASEGEEDDQVIIDVLAMYGWATPTLLRDVKALKATSRVLTARVDHLYFRFDGLTTSFNNLKDKCTNGFSFLFVFFFAWLFNKRSTEEKISQVTESVEQLGTSVKKERGQRIEATNKHEHQLVGITSTVEQLGNSVKKERSQRTKATNKHEHDLTELSEKVAASSNRLTHTTEILGERITNSAKANLGRLAEHKEGTKERFTKIADALVE